MKIIISLVCLFGFHFGVFAQSALELKGYYGISSTQLARKVDLVGTGGVQMNNLNEFGFLLSKSVSEKFRLTGGVGYSYSEVRYQPPFCSNCGEEYNSGRISDFKLLSFPIYAEYTLGKYFYVGVGPIIDLELSNEETYSDLSGIGYLIGLGARWQAEKFTFSIFPNYKRHGMIPFDNSSKFKYLLQEIGIQAGVRYSF